MEFVELSINVDRVRLDASLIEAKEIGIEDEREFFDNAFILLEWAIGEIKKGGIVGAIYKNKKTISEPILPFMLKKDRNLQ